jgi:hypothetical protein
VGQEVKLQLAIWEVHHQVLSTQSAKESKSDEQKFLSLFSFFLCDL